MAMELKTFRQNLAIYGADFSRWGGGDPGVAKDAAALLADSNEARALMDEALALDYALAACDDVPEFDEKALAGRIMTAVAAGDVEEHSLDDMVANDGVLTAGTMPPHIAARQIASARPRAAFGARPAFMALFVVLAIGLGAGALGLKVPEGQKPDGQQGGLSMAAASGQVDTLVTQMAQNKTQALEMQQMLAYFDADDKRPAAQKPEQNSGQNLDEEIDNYLAEEISAQTRSKNIWDMFYKDGSAAL